MSVQQETGRGYRISFPPNVDRRRILGPIDTLAVDESSEYRRLVTRASPLTFALVYLPHYLILEGTDRIALSEFHVDVARAARRWRRHEQFRDGWLGPRGLGKTVWFFLILPLWALAHGHRKFFLAFSYTQPQAVGHLANLRMELEQNELLRQDFPELAPKRIRGATNSAATVVASGATIAARGLGETALGIRSGAARPDLIVGDDMEPSEMDYTPAAKAKLLAKLIDGIIPMGTAATAVQLTGTVTMYRSITHDLVLHALAEAGRGGEHVPWVDDAEIRARYYPGVLIDPETGAERSLWPQRWRLTDTHLGEHKRGTRGFALNYELNPRPEDGEGGSMWNDDTIVYDRHFPAVRFLLYIDTAVTTKARSDFTAFVVVGVDASGRRACVYRAWAGKINGKEMRDKVWTWHEQNPGLREVYVEANHGGDLWVNDILTPVPPGVRVYADRAQGSKIARAKVSLDHYQRGAVFHARPLKALEEQLKSFPDPRQHDDLVDSLSGALRKAFKPGP